MSVPNSKPRAFASLRIATALAALCAGAPLALAGDWYVDAVHGADANDGTSAATAWRTLTHALASIPAVPLVAETVHVAPGLYDPALGESFPLNPRPLVRLVGTEGSARTVLAGAASSFLVYSGDATHVFDAQSGASGFTLRDGATGVLVASSDRTTAPAFADLLIERMSQLGVDVVASPAPDASATAAPTFESTALSECQRGLRAHAAAGSLQSANARAELTESAVRASVGDGIRIEATGNAAASVRLRRCRVVSNGGSGVTSFAGGAITSASLFAYATLFASNGNCGVLGDTGTHGEAGSSWFVGCTLAHNAAAGARALHDHRLDFESSNVAGNGDDVDALVPPTGSDSNCADGDLLGLPGCIAADPLFVDPIAGDFRLRFGSPCADAGDPATAGELDLLGHARPFDGDLDEIAVPDMGAFELETLHVEGEPRPGGALRFELWGAPGAHVRLYFAEHPIAGRSGAGGPFDVVRIDPKDPPVLGDYVIAAAPLVLVRGIPDDPWWIGRSFTAQALIGSSAAPHGTAASNATPIAIEP